MKSIFIKTLLFSKFWPKQQPALIIMNCCKRRPPRPISSIEAATIIDGRWDENTHYRNMKGGVACANGLVSAVVVLLSLILMGVLIGLFYYVVASRTHALEPP